jgi:hypothetical protein
MAPIFEDHKQTGGRKFYVIKFTEFGRTISLELAGLSDVRAWSRISLRSCELHLLHLLMGEFLGRGPRSHYVSGDTDMSMEVYVLSDEQLPSIEAWQQSIDAAGFALRLSTERPFAALRGALPVILGDRASSFECDHWDAATLMAEMPDVAFGRPWAYALAFRWGADIDGGAAAYMAAAAYATATGGAGVRLRRRQADLAGPRP